MSDSVIPERYGEEYRSVTNCEHIPYRRQASIIEDLGTAEAKVAELEKRCERYRAALVRIADCYKEWDATAIADEALNDDDYKEGQL